MSYWSTSARFKPRSLWPVRCLDTSRTDRFGWMLATKPKAERGNSIFCTQNPKKLINEKNVAAKLNIKLKEYIGKAEKTLAYQLIGNCKFRPIESSTDYEVGNKRLANEDYQRNRGVTRENYSQVCSRYSWWHSETESSFFRCRSRYIFFNHY